MWTNKIPSQGKRVLMLTPDVMIDRRILIEAETLIDEGYEVYLLAGWDGKSEDLFEVEGRVKVERIKYEGIDQRLTVLYKSQNYLISSLNQISSGVDVTASKICLALNSIYGLLTQLLSKLIYILIFKPVLLFINITLKTKNFFITSIAKTINLSVQFTVKMYPIFSDLNGYEYLFFKKGLFYRPDIIHVHDLPMLKAGVEIKIALNVPLIYDMHEFYSEQDCLTPLQQKNLRKTESINIKYTDARITVNPMLADEISKSYNNISIEVIQNAMIINSDFHNHQYDRFRQEYSISKEDIILLYQGWISPARNLQNLVKGLAQVDKPIKLVMMGYGDFKEDLKKIAESLNIKQKVIFVPTKNQAELLSYTASADIGIIPYPFKLDPNTKYASPNKLYEFIVSRLPIICNNLPFVKSIIETNGFGIAFDMDTPESFAEALNNFPFDKLEYFKTNLSEKGHNFLWEAEALKLLEIYRNISK
ncbi:glycosyltransferase [Sphaerospermopsis sp. FACHB-1094]|uniref:glycosyltransferase n=1 Tax=Sphaerospermopsis sp. FACHB-1094 TaxID=2692861 RepID=UPI001688835F|nr:glycosyltransferase [Sphaerospermopsis sp. FACHB-1094]MBD2131562.1 glycosyltransferase [Sphaerospermopsis sp. FACHB-1094]